MADPGRREAPPPAPPVENPFPEDVWPHGEMKRSVELGAVDHRSVRLWLRLPDTRHATADLHVEGRPVVHGEATLVPESDWCGAIHLRLDEPAPGAPFTCRCDGRTFRGRLFPPPGAPSELRFAFGSCHCPYVECGDRLEDSPPVGIYNAMADELKAWGCALLLLGGDQWYADEFEVTNVRKLLGEDRREVPSYELAVAVYRHLARGFMGFPSYARLRRSVPCCCMWDDHDIFDNWGSIRPVSAFDQRLFEAASRVFCEYQNLRNPCGGVAAPPYHYSIEHGDVGILVTDTRGARDWSAGKLLGDPQWDFLREYVAGASGRRMQTLFIFTSVPVAHVSRWVTRLLDGLGGSMGNTVRDRWTASAFIDQRDALLDLLFEWMRGDEYRQVFLLSGDVHVASAFDIFDGSGRRAIHQLTSSAITTTMTWGERQMNRLGVLAPNLFERRWRLRRHFRCNANNFGRVRVAPLPEGGHRVEFLVRGWQIGAERLDTMAHLVAEPQREVEAGLGAPAPPRSHRTESPAHRNARRRS
ncbi:MAG: alkaline phosphatase D family protein [Candidatus Krumholzibacteriia bacterium]